MKELKNLVEYYDELFPVTENQENFYDNLIKDYKNPVKFLRIFSGTGLFESKMAKKGHDVTGIEDEHSLLEAANLRRRNQLMAIRFFNMNHQEMINFLAKGFYNVISVLDSRLMFLKSSAEIEKFFVNCKQLLSENGVLIFQMINFEKFQNVPMAQLKERKSMRSKLFTELFDNNGCKTISMNLETGNGKVISIFKNYEVNPILPKDIEMYAKKAKFSSANFYSDFDKSEFTGNEESFIVILK